MCKKMCMRARQKQLQKHANTYYAHYQSIHTIVVHIVMRAGQPEVF